MNNLNDQQKQLHAKIFSLCTQHKNLEAEIIVLLGQIEKQRVFQRLGFASLFEYAVKSLGLSEANAYAFILVARKSREIKSLHQALQSQNLSVSKAARMVSVLNLNNAEELVSFAISHTSRQIGQKVAELRPRSRVKENIKPLSSNWMKLECSITQEVSLKLKRAQSLLSSRKAQAMDLNETLNDMLDLYLKAYDPIEKAKRALKKVNSREGSEVQRHEAQPGKTPTLNSVEASRQSLKAKFQSQQTLSLPLKMKSEILSEDSPHSFCPSKTTSVRPFESDSASQIYSEEPGSLLNTPHQRSENSDSQAQNPKNRRRPLTARQKHTVYHKDQGRCTFINENGERCTQERWLREPSSGYNTDQFQSRKPISTLGWVIT